MGRLTRMAAADAEEHAFALQHCAPGAGGVNCTTLRADGARGTTRFAALPPHAPTRALANQTTRSRKCGNCDAHHETNFVNRDGSGTPLGAAPGREPLSVGRPVKLSTARLLAVHLRRAVCGGNASCPELLTKLDIPLADWTRDSFLAAALRPPDIANLTAKAPNDTALWARPWVWCVKDGVCSGRVERATWIDPHTRGATCSDAMQQAAAEGALPVHFCTVDAQSERTCAKVAEWQLEISRILCRALGFAECQERAHVYAPTTYSVSNGEFVHDTVRAFYDNSGVECAVELSDDQLKQKVSNDNLKERCASTSLVPLRTALRKLREIKTLAIELVFYVSSAGSQVRFLDERSARRCALCSPMRALLADARSARRRALCSPTRALFAPFACRPGRLTKCAKCAKCARRSACSWPACSRRPPTAAP